MLTEPQSAIVTCVVRTLVPFVQLFGLYVIVHGHTSPGGGFQGGVILAASAILLSLAFGARDLQRRFSVMALTSFTSAGVLLYAGIGVVCLLLGANFLDYGILPGAEPRSLGMLGIEIGVGITVTAALILIFYEILTFE
tara:strand:+ start:176 stop:592 length:417 start_codon:yes stop_codon:yes gene_type:complete